MGSSSKMANLERGEDKISTLPEEVLIYILSLMSTRDAFRTSLLSSRWENLWASVPNLSFCPTDGNTEGWTIEDLNPVYMNFIDRILLLHNSDINKFHLNCTPQIDSFRVHAWINTVVKRNVREITFSTVYGENQPFPISLFTCKTLEILKLDIYLHLNVPSTVHFPCLKVLHVTLTAPSKDLTEKLFCSSPVLEELKFIVLGDSGKLIYNIFSPSLKKLSIEIRTNRLEGYDSRVMIDAPILEDLEVSDHFNVRYILTKGSSITRASLNIGICDRKFKDLEGMQLVDKLYLLLVSISSVEDLFLTFSTIEALRASIEKKWPVFYNVKNLRLEVITDIFDAESLSKWPIFPHLRHLRFHFDDKLGLKNLTHLLMWAPDLASLVLEKEAFVSFTEPVEEFDPSEIGVLKCLQSCLEKIELRNVEGSSNDLKLIEYLLENGQVLKTLTVKFCDIDNLFEVEFRKLILEMPRRSELCEITFV